LQILVSLRVLRTESQYFYPHRYRLGLCVKKYLYYTVLVVYPSILRNSFPGHLDGFERTLSVLSSRVRVSHPSERQLLSDLDILLHIVNQQRQYCVNLSYFALHEEDEQQSTTRVGVRIVRSGVGLPRLDIS